MSKQHYDALIQAERKFREVLPEFDKMEDCGEDCTEIRQLVTDRLGKIEALKRNYAP
jgi:hypothetical protein